MSLSGKVAFITGASSGIGEGIARVLVKNNVKVVITARRKEKLDALKADIEKTHKKAHVLALELDVRKRSDFKAAVEKAIASFGQVDILVNNAGVMKLSWARNLQESEWEEMVDINIKGVMNGVGAVLDHMRKRGSGDIINISSDADRKAWTGSSVYSGTKAFVTLFSEGVRQELAEEKCPVRVTSLSPGATESELGTHITDKTLPPWTPIKLITAEECANVVLFVLQQPPHVAVYNVMFRPSDQTS